MKAVVITASDKGSQGKRIDESGKLLKQMLEDSGYTIVGYEVLPDEREVITKSLIKWCDKKVELIATTGGTGFSKRDITPEATLDVIERETRGIAEAMRYSSLQITKRAMLSRAVAGIRGETLIVNLPGSPKAVKENLEFVLDDLKHGIEILKGSASECAKPISK